MTDPVIPHSHCRHAGNCEEHQRAHHGLAGEWLELAILALAFILILLTAKSAGA